jgi:enterochelin esterase-like enzyme
MTEATRDVLDGKGAVQVSLTGGFLGFLLWAVAVLLFAWIVVRPRAAATGWAALLRRAGYQLAVIATVVLAVGVSLNDQYGWYANWGDLGTAFSATDPGNVVAAGAAAAQAAGPNGGTSGVDHQAVPLTELPSASTLGLSDRPSPAAGQIKDFLITGPISRLTSTITVWFPPQYTDPAMAGHRFPVLEAFHGTPGSPRQLYYNMSLSQLVAQQTAAGNLAPSIIVMPFYTPGQLDTECVDGGPGQPQVEQWLTRDVTNWVEHHLRVGNSRTSWATFGLSAGAWCASMLAMLHPDLYSAGISLGGYFQPSFGPPYIPFKPGSPQWEHYDLLKVAHDHPPRVALWVQTSKADTVSYSTTEQLLATARPPTSITADVLPNAGHRLSVWTGLIPQTLQWLGRTSPGFEPAPVLRLPGWAPPGSTTGLRPPH